MIKRLFKMTLLAKPIIGANDTNKVALVLAKLLLD
jgi:hypothetical protein